MTAAQRGAYWQLICWQMQSDDGTLPSDVAALSALADLDLADGNGCVLDAFPVQPCGRRANQRAAAEWQKRRAISGKRSEVGGKGIAQRWQTDSKPIANPLQTDSNCYSKPIANPLQTDSNCYSKPIAIATTTTTTSTTTATPRVREGDIPPPTTHPTRFERPSTAQVSEYAKSIGYTSLDPDRFCSHYDSVGWKVGKNPMKDWRAAVRTWMSADKAAGRVAGPSVDQQALADYAKQYREACRRGDDAEKARIIAKAQDNMRPNGRQLLLAEVSRQNSEDASQKGGMR